MIDRRSMLSAALAAIAAVSSSRQSLAQAGMSRITACLLYTSDAADE